jgi:NitT/TauT family transport system substrate-binding protein
MALAEMKKQGYNITQTTVNGADPATQALASNQAQLTENNPTVAAAAVQKGAPLKAVIEMAGDEVAWVAAPGFEDCNDLTGKPVGIFSPVSGYTKLMQLYFSKHCPNVKPKYVIIPDSGLRAQALGADKIDGSALALPDAMNLQAKYPDKKFFIKSLNTEFPGIAANYLFTNEQTIKDHPDILKALITDSLKAVRQIYANPDQFATYMKGVGLGDQATAAKTFLDNKLWASNGGDILGGLKATYPVEDLPGDPANLADDSILKAVLANIGTSDATTN